MTHLTTKACAQWVKGRTEDHKACDHSDDYFPIDIMLVSHAFERTPVLKGLLVYLWEHRGKEFSEYAIATEALGRHPDFDPKVDATVRVGISRLRQRLKEFYETEGTTTRVRVRIPLGSHYLEVFQTEAPPGAKEKEVSGFQSVRGIWSKLLLSFVGCCITLLAVVTYFRIEPTRTKVTPSPSKVESLPHFWQSFLANGRPSHIIIPRPTFFMWGSDLIVRDTYVNDFSGWRSSPNLEGMERRLGSPPSRMQTYAVADDALGAIRLVSFLQAHSLPVTATTGADAPADLLERENVIALGTSKTLSDFEKSAGLTASLDFHLEPGERCVENRRPAKGEPQKFLYSISSGGTTVWPGTLAVLPGKDPNTHLLMLKAAPTGGLATFLTSTAELNQLEKMWGAHGSPQYFEAVVVIQMSDNQYIKAWPVAMHAWHGSH